MNKRIIRVIMFICIAIDFLFIIGVEYVDSVINCSWGYAFWDVVFRKTDCSMYEYLMSNAISPYEAPMGYSWLVELPIALWELPIYALYNMMGKTIVYNSLLLYWYKLLLIIISMGIIFVGLKCAKTNFSGGGLFFVALFGSGEYVLSAFYGGQDEIIYVFALMCFIYGNITERRVLERVCMAISVTLNPICLIVILPVLLINEKKLFKVAIRLLESCVPLIVFSYLYRADELYLQFSHVSDNSSHLFLPGIALNYDLIPIPLFPIFYVILILYLYMYEENDKKLIARTKLLAVASSFALLSLLSAGQIGLFYRGMLWLPFFVTYIFMTGLDGLNILLLSAYECLRSLTLLFPLSNFAGVSSSWVMQSKIIDMVCKVPEKTMYEVLCGKISFLNNSGLVYALVIALMSCILFYNWKYQLWGQSKDVAHLKSNDVKFISAGLYIFSSIILLVAFMLNITVLV